jgi:hypothetical protein
MGARRVTLWRRLCDRSGYDYRKVSDDDLLSMKAIARHEAAMFAADGRAVFAEVIHRTGLFAINVEIQARRKKKRS